MHDSLHEKLKGLVASQSNQLNNLLIFLIDMVKML